MSEASTKIPGFNFFPKNEDAAYSSIKSTKHFADDTGDLPEVWEQQRLRLASANERFRRIVNSIPQMHKL